MDSQCILLVSNSRDFATDYVVAELRARGKRYLRLDLDLVAKDSVTIDPSKPMLDIHTPQGRFRLTAPEIVGILFRAPTHLSESGSDRYTPQEQLARHQWAAFARALMVFETARWVNHPAQTYAAESKPFQLFLASQLGWDIPETRITNFPPENNWPESDGRLAIKALDTFFVRLDDQDAFFYTQEVDRSDLLPASLSAMPVILQPFLANKLDLRVTVIGKHCMAAAICRNGVGVTGDWRLQKDTVDYQLYDLPPAIRDRCIKLVDHLGLIFGAVDIAFCNGRYVFLEVNPTGEWAWLAERLNFPVANLLVDALCGDLPKQECA